MVTSLAPIMNPSLSADSLRALVRARAKAGAEAIKLFASRSLGDGGAPTMSEEQLAAICGEARSQGIRSVTHAHGAEAIRRAVMAGCGQIEHGVFADQEVIQLMAERGTWFDPQCSAVFENYIEHRTSWFAGSNYATPDGLALLERALVLGPQVIRMALATPGLRLVFGTDAVATGNGRSVDDMMCRVRKAGQDPMDAIVTATSRNAEALGIGNETGSIVPGLKADLIIVDGDPLRDIGALSKVVLVIKDGRVRYQ
jgi:imidazolonepropionase-like amidohydrolase